MQKNYLGLIAAALCAAVLAGCSSSGSGGDSTLGAETTTFTTDSDSVTIGSAGLQLAGHEQDINVVGADTCIDCHGDVVAAAQAQATGTGLSWSVDDVAAYLRGPHVIHSTGIDQQTAQAQGCAVCHDPIGDGPTLEPFIDQANVPEGGLAAVTCEVCHGAGGQHFGIAPIPTANPDFELCGACHNALPDDHIPQHPLGDNILANYQQSAHATGTVRENNPCFRCHSDEGFRMFIDETFQLDGNSLEQALAGQAPLTTASQIQCRTCHDPHSGEMRTPATEGSIALTLADGSTSRVHPVEFSAQFNLCTSCHQISLNAEAVTPVNADGDEEFESFNYTLAFDPATMEGAPFHANDAGDTPLTATSRTIWDTHFRYLDPADDTTVLIEGYNINAASENACSQCHDPHAASKFQQAFASNIATAWGNTEGFHGDYQAEAFLHEFDSEVCMKCHNGTEFVKIVKGLDPADLELKDAQVIACVSCHNLQAQDVSDLDSDSNTSEIYLGYLREFTDLEGNPVDTVTFPSGKTVEGVGENQFCMTCHSGRASKADVDAATAGSDGTFRFVNIHYRAAAATLFGNMAQGGYEFDGKSYASKFEHVDSNDLCIECHSPHSGRLAIAENNTEGAKPCIDCHDITTDPAVDYDAALLEVRDIRMRGTMVDYDGDGDTAEGIYYEVDTLKTELQTALQNAGVEILPGYPYFGNLTTKAQLEAAYNLQLAARDTGSWAHNSAYVIELLVDSLEALGVTANSTTGNPFIRDENGHFNAAAEAFRHWDEDGEVSTACGRCHSSEGAAAFFTNGEVTTADYEPYTMGISAGLACEACHLPDSTPGDTAFDGAVRQVASVTFPSGVTLTAAEAPLFFANASPLCMDCHQGRESGLSLASATPGEDGTFRFVNIHYYAAAATLFGSVVQGGYQYEGQTYAGTNTFPAHPDALKTCAGCHVDDDPTAPHDFLPEVATCTACHNAGGNTFETLSGSPGQNFTDIQTLKGELQTLLEASGVTFLPGYPYFGNITTREQLQAAYNWQVADKEPCGYIHNGDYIKQLLFDSITALGGTPSVARP